MKRAELEQLHLQQQKLLSQTEAEKRELEAEQLAKERDLQAAMQQLDGLEKERQGAREQYEVRSHTALHADLRTGTDLIKGSAGRMESLKLCLVINLLMFVFVHFHWYSKPSTKIQ